MGTEEIAQDKVIELRRPTAQIVRSVLPWMVLAPYFVVLNFQSFTSIPIRVATVVFWIVIVVQIAVPQFQFVLRMSEDGIYEGRSNGKKLGLLGPAPLRLAWRDITDIRVVEGWKTRSVDLRTRPYPRMLRYVPRTSVLNPDRSFDEHVALLRSIWLVHRVLPPPPAPPPG